MSCFSALTNIGQESAILETPTTSCTSSARYIESSYLDSQSSSLPLQELGAALVEALDSYITECSVTPTFSPKHPIISLPQFFLPTRPMKPKVTKSALTNPVNPVTSSRVDVHKQLLKTKVCKLFREGKCNYGKNCFFAHTAEELRLLPDLRKTNICKLFLIGKCPLKENCRFAHGSKELRATEGAYKTVLCQWFKQGYCHHGIKCRFAHGRAELMEQKPQHSLIQLARGTTQSSCPSSDKFSSLPLKALDMCQLCYERSSLAVGDGEERKVFYPCGHGGVCESCAENILTCPTCYAKIKEIIKVYIPRQMV